MIAETKPVLAGIMRRIDEILRSADESLSLVDPLPTTDAEFAALPLIQRTAATAFLKNVEQAQDQIARLLRAIAVGLAIDTESFYARDYGNLGEKLGIIPDAKDWTSFAMLRNKLAHDYPLTVTARRAAVELALGRLPYARDVARRARAWLIENGVEPEREP